MTTKHTPGPWTTKELVGARDKDNAYIFGPDDQLIGSALAYGRQASEGQANAGLMAAAPELLAALEKIADTAERNAPHMPNVPGARETMDFIGRKARAAIDKATE